MTNAAWRSYWSVFGGLLALVAALASGLMLSAPPTPPASDRSTTTRLPHTPAVTTTSESATAPIVHATAGEPAPPAQALVSPAGFMRAPSGGLLPRFMTLAKANAQIRMGPGGRYPVAWTIRTRGMPLEVLAEAGDWLRVRDHEGEEGWLHASSLTDRWRAALVAPWHHGTKIALRTQRSADSPMRAWISAGVAVRLLACDGKWCQVQVHAMQGWLEQAQLWGIYHRERIQPTGG